MTNKPNCGTCNTGQGAIPNSYSPPSHGSSPSSHLQSHVPLNTGRSVSPIYTQDPYLSGCGSCGTSSCSCKTSSILEASFCPEKHCVDPCATICKSKFYLETLSGFNFPECNGTARIRVEDTCGLVDGMLLYSAETGYVILDRILDKYTIEIKNPCQDGTIATAGKPIPSNIKFIPSAPGVAGTGTNQGCLDQKTRPYLDKPGFITPRVNETVEVKVSNVSGLSPNDRVSLNGYEYKITEIRDAYTIVLLNDGEGDIPGTALDADDDCNGCLDFPIIRIAGENPCAKSSVESGLPIVCKNGEQFPLKGDKDNQILIYNEQTEQFELRLIPQFSICGELTSCLYLDPLNTTGYPITVGGDDLSFISDVAPDNIIQIGTRDFIVNEVVTNTGTSAFIRVTPVVPVLALENVPVNTAVCEASCCTKLENQLECSPTVIAPNCPAFTALVIPINVDLTLANSFTYVHPAPIYTCSYTNNTNCLQLVVFDINILNRIGYTGTDDIGIVHDFHLSVDGDVNQNPRFTHSQKGSIAIGDLNNDEGPFRGPAPQTTTFGFASGTLLAQKKVVAGGTVTFTVDAKAFYAKGAGSNQAYTCGMVTTGSANLRVFNTD